MPQFYAGEKKIARVPMTNPTAKPFDYNAVLYMGTNLAVMAQVSFSLAAGETKEISLPVTMPADAGTYPAYIGVFSEGKSIALYKAVEDVVVLAPRREVTLQAVLYFDPAENAWLILKEGATVHFYGELRLYTGYLNPYWLPYTCYAEFIVITPSGARKTVRTSSVVMYYSAGVFDPVEIYSYEQGKYTVTVNLYTNGILQDTLTFNVNDAWV